MWKKLHNPIFDISEQNITVHALQENCNKKTPNNQTKIPNNKKPKKEPDTLKKGPHTKQTAFTYFTHGRYCDSTCIYHERKHRQATGNHFTASLWTLLKNNWNRGSYPVGRWNWWKSCVTDKMSLQQAAPFLFSKHWQVTGLTWRQQLRETIAQNLLEKKKS